MPADFNSSRLASYSDRSSASTGCLARISSAIAETLGKRSKGDSLRPRPPPTDVRRIDHPTDRAHGQVSTVAHARSEVAHQHVAERRPDSGRVDVPGALR